MIDWTEEKAKTVDGLPGPRRRSAPRTQRSDVVDEVLGYLFVAAMMCVVAATFIAATWASFNPERLDAEQLCPEASRHCTDG